MKRRGALGAAVAATALASGCALYAYLQPPAGASPEYAHWTPTAAAIRQKVGTMDVPTPGMTEAARRSEFCTMFKNRYRHHEPAVAVGLHFLSPTKIKLMCPARMEPCYIDQIALSLWREARDAFGPQMDIDIYDTFIGTTQIKIGELRAAARTPAVALISYDFNMLKLINRKPVQVMTPRHRHILPPPVPADAGAAFGRLGPRTL